jgi:hypothetical protein
MSHGFKLSRRIARFRAPIFAVLIAALFGCDNNDAFNPDSTQPDADQGTTLDPTSELDPISELGPTSELDTLFEVEEDIFPEEELAPVDDAPLAAVSFAGGIPIGSAHQPNGAFGSRYNGALRNIYPAYLLRELAAIKARGGKVVLMMAGADWLYKDANGHFSLSKWKARIDRYRNVDFSSYVRSGTLVGHYLIDEPNNAARWNGRVIPGTTVDEMARYSKQKWPGLATIVRTYPTYLERWGPYRYLDAAWAQYVHRFGDAGSFTNQHVNSAKRQGLALIVGLNYLKGGPDRRKMTASQVRSWGSTLLSSSYPCAFISWKYDDNYLSTSGIRDAMSYLRNKAESRSARSCRGS